ncbi:hypothetical protein BJ875DRAFT_465157 [Amylocarpus encephaloides]|uniref:DUF7730 domain-containing protein n=1 Tax=Amylocarpus encephaloides TaxID=45428 RepID=A0A9P7YFY5_9HELO|nr:hypothetical protein BJ875DRAFT_465157 [Amylocarpus encephaloides]
MPDWNPFSRWTRPRGPGEAKSFRDFLVVPKKPKTRKRALTLPLPSSASDKQTTASQSHSALLSLLPAEIRDQIWELCVTGHALHLQLCSGRLWQKLPSTSEGWEPKRGLLSLPLTCRQIYSESITLLYSGNTFAFSFPPVILHLDRVILPRRLSCLTDIRFTWTLENLPTPADTVKWSKWVAIWQVLASWPRLRRLRVEFKVINMWDASGDLLDFALQEAEWLEPLSVVDQPEIFRLYLPWRALPGSQVEARGPFEITRIHEDWAHFQDPWIEPFSLSSSRSNAVAIRNDSLILRD